MRNNMKDRIYEIVWRGKDFDEYIILHKVCWEYNHQKEEWPKPSRTWKHFMADDKIKNDKCDWCGKPFAYGPVIKNSHCSFTVKERLT